MTGRKHLARLVRFAIESDIGREVVAPKRFQRRERFLFRQDARQADLKRPALTQHLINFAARAGVDRVGLVRVRFGDEPARMMEPNVGIQDAMPTLSR
jgi:hypothetical protein